MTDKLQHYTCKNCTAPLDITTAAGGVVKCAYCGSKFVLPKSGLPEKARITLVSAENALDTCDFDKAYTLFQKAIELDQTEPQSYFGAALAKHKVQYLKDTVNNRLQPICHEMTRARFGDDKNYKTALDLATPEQKEEYKNKAEEIDYINDKFKEQAENGADYDCFICVKVTDGETLTRDYKKASELYFALQKKNYKPFFSEYSMTDLVGADYEAVILYALYKSKCMLIVCGNEEYLETPWVKNEYTRFIELMTDEQKERNSIAIAYFNKPIERLPGLRGKLQGVDLNNLSAVEQICGFIDKCDPEKQVQAKKLAEERAAEQDKQKAEEIARIKAEAEKRAEEERERREEVERKAQEAAERAAKLEEEMNRMRQEMQAAKEQAAQAQTSTAQSTPKPQNNTAKQQAPKLQESPKSDFEIKDGAIVKYKGNGGDVVIPYGVTAIGENAFEGCSSITSITIPDSVTSIGCGAFYECGSIKSITIPDSVTSIGAGAFDWCSSLESVTIPDSVTSIGDVEFGWCSSLTSIAVNSGNVKYHSMGNCLIGTATKKLIASCKNSVIPDDGSVTEICAGAFSGRSSLTSITIPNSVTKIGDAAFEDCSSLTSVVIPDSVKSIGYAAFCGCDSLTSITIPDSVTYISDLAFAECKNLKNVSLPNNCKVENNTFDECPNVNILRRGVAQTTPKVQATAKTVSKPTLKPQESPISDFEIKDGVITKYKGKGGDVVIPYGVTAIGGSAFYGCSSLTSVTIPDSVTKIGGAVLCGAFFGCSSLTSVVIPKSVTSIGEYAFKDCRSLENVTISDSVNSIGRYAFKDCSSITSITIPDSVTSIGDNVFLGCSKNLVITCYRKKPLIGMPKGYGKNWNGGAEVVWKK